jgi:DDE superfamily endonuclease
MFKDSNIGNGIPPDINTVVDKGFDGIKTEYPDLTVTIPKKKPKGKELTEQEKEENKKISSKRIVNEHALAQIKKYNCVSHIYRNKGNDKADRFMFIACGLSNYHLQYKEVA